MTDGTTKTTRLHEQVCEAADVNNRSAYDQALHEILRLRDKNRELNWRAQRADAAATDAKKCLDRMARDGVPWVQGSLGRAMLAWHNSQLQDALAAKDAELRAARACQETGA